MLGEAHERRIVLGKPRKDREDNVDEEIQNWKWNTCGRDYGYLWEWLVMIGEKRSIGRLATGASSLKSAAEQTCNGQDCVFSSVAT